MRCCEDLKRALILKVRFQAGEMVAGHYSMQIIKTEAQTEGDGKRLLNEAEVKSRLSPSAFQEAFGIFPASRPSLLKRCSNSFLLFS